MMTASDVDAATMRRMEEALLATWPGLDAWRDGDWVAQYADGLTDRSNSLYVLDSGDDGSLEARLDKAAAFYRKHKHPLTLRATPLTPDSLMAHCDAAGWSTFDTTHMLLGDLPQAAECALPDGLTMKATPNLTEDWLNGVQACLHRTDDQNATLAGMMMELQGDALFIHIENAQGAIIGVTLAAVFNRLLTVHNVAVAGSARRQGLANAMMQASIGFGHSVGAQQFWIAVDEGNTPAISLYKRLGLVQVYDYVYRRPPA